MSDDDEDIDAKLRSRDKTIAELTAKIASKHVAKVTMSTETADVPLDSATYWVDASANNKKEVYSCCNFCVAATTLMRIQRLRR